jgi:CubicO group peptidase (beta-lactamase class C family)
MKIKFLALTLCLTAALVAQPRKMVRVGGGPDPAMTKDWPKLTAKANVADADVAPAVGAYLDALVARDLFSGTVLITHDGKQLFFKSYGLANKDFAVANTNDTRYNVGSINKVFTKAALMQLRDEGKLDFSKTLRTYLPDYPSDLADRVTIKQLLDFTSGMGDFFGPEFASTPKDRIRTLNDYLELFAKKPLEFEPGSSRRYSNAGYIVLGLVIEKVSGMSYYDYVQKKIFAPLEMNDTASFPADAIVPKRAVGYTSEDGPRRANTYTLPGRGSSAGGGYSTATDLLRFVTGARKVLSPAAFDELIGDPPGIGFAGGSPGVNAVVELEGRWSIIVLSNYDPPAAMEVGANVRTLLGLGGE